MSDSINDSKTINKKESWGDTLKLFLNPSVLTMLFLGFSAGIPILLIFSSLGLWLREAGVERSAVTFFSWAALGYSFKFVWAPLVDKLPLPILTRLLGRRRSWILLSQFAIILAILWMSQTDPSNDESLTLMAIAAVLLGFSSATQDVVIDAYRIESAETDLQALMSSTYIAGYRIGMLVAGAGALYLASFFGSEKGAYNYQAWEYSYMIMAGVMLVGVITTLLIPEPAQSKDKSTQYSADDYLRFLFLFIAIVIAFILTFYFSSDISKELKSSLKVTLDNKHLANFIVALIRLITAIAFAGLVAFVLVKARLVNKAMVKETYVAPVQDFFLRYGYSLAFLLLALIGLYRIADIVLGVISNVFYQDLGFSKPEIASVVKTFGLLMTIVGGFLGGLLSVRFGVMRILFLGALLSALTNLLFMALAGAGYNMPMLYLVISADNLSAGLASAAFIAFLSSLTNISFTAVQFAIFSSLMTLLPKILGGYSGSMVDEVGYPNFFLITAIMGIPVLVLIFIAGKKLELKQNSEA
ncbi:MFS transporter [Cocleimonas sp. KMM 6892]|uniref:AmpG family muropeptide MFS transporter n=1 Tax=unclassified Cocleimonas TaxID=2639732 RepID=UPI002DBD98C8|nr:MULTISPECIES: MFS transporter [unclassified Cocleimonas]MEB8431306.1 MFS transporter [Cocleimonas sp. KMM 6892]MEC4713922.1 MFS transporter [Cocleimonas sp. KMM 6895]MEC4743253.1 MFS transporter [Cocleimonas sp. KMM 6896]